MIPITQSSWEDLLIELRRCDKGLLRAWLYDLDLPKLAGGVMTLSARNEAQLRHLERCRSALARSAQVALGRLVSLHLQLDAYSAHSDPDRNIPPQRGLRADFTMDRFVVGHENQMAHAAALQFSREPGGAYNPLFLHGPSGSGKTHLLQATCRASMAAIEASVAVYVSADEFIAHFTGCFEAAVPYRFRQRYTEADVLALDDVQVFAGKSRSQEELFHVINSVLTAGKRLVLAADRPPTAIGGLETRLTSRFGAGLVIAMDPPGTESRMRIIEQKDRSECYGFPPDALRQIAERCAPADLDTILARLDSVAQSHGGSVTADLVNDVFRDHPQEATIA